MSRRRGRKMDRRKSLRQLSKELGVSASYLSQIKHGRRPASPKVLGKVLSISANQCLSEPFFPAIIQAVFEHHTLPSGVVAAQGNLDPLAQVRILARQPTPPPAPLHHHSTLTEKEAGDSVGPRRLMLQRGRNQTDSVDTGDSGRR
jgi:transcriptional regulator with XRE-family HTH domain